MWFSESRGWKFLPRKSTTIPGIDSGEHVFPMGHDKNLD